MPGEFSKANRPDRPGSYFDFNARQATPPLPGLGGIVAVAFTNDWGPLDTPTLLRSFGDYRTNFGDSTDTIGYRAVRQTFQGEGLPGFGGASAVLAYRMAGSAAAKAAHVFQNTTPATALTLTAKYEGSRGNDLNVTVQDLAGTQSPEQDELIIYDGATEVERYSYTDTDMVALAALINARSRWVTAASGTTGVALTYVANVALTAGNDGSTLLAADYTDMMSDIEIERFSVITFEAPADNTILTALKTWAINARKQGKRFRVAIGGALDEAVATATARSILFNDEAFVNVGCGSVIDETLGVLSTSQLAPRVAGIMAARGETRSLTYARFAGLALRNGPTDADISICFDAGVTVLARDSNPAAPVRIEKGLTTFTTLTNLDKPYLIFRDPKFIATMDAIQMACQEFGEQDVVGKMNVDAAARAFVRSYVSSRILQPRQDAGILQPGWSVMDDNDPPPTAQDDFMQFLLAFVFGRTAEQIYFTASVS